jgi:hypothetical protein
LKAVVIKDVSALHAAVGDLKAAGVKCDLVQNQTPRMYYSSQHGNCAYVLKLHDSAYDVGFDLQADGSYLPVFDEWANHVSSQIGAGSTCPLPTTQEGRAQHAIGKFAQSYAKHAAINSAVSQGYMVEGTEIDADGNVHLMLTGM